MYGREKQKQKNQTKFIFMFIFLFFHSPERVGLSPSKEHTAAALLCAILLVRRTGFPRLTRHDFSDLSD